MQFSYKGRNTTGGEVEGVVEAPSRADAIGIIRNTNVTPSVIVEKHTFSLSFDNFSFSKSVKLSEKIIFTKNLSGMLRAGLALTRGLQILARQTGNKYFKKIIDDVIATIDRGGTFSEGLAKYPTVFSNLFVAMVRTGEESGGLPEALIEVQTNLDKSYSLNRKIKSALMYPSIIFSAIIIIGILMFIYVVPTLTSTFAELNAKLPASTQFIVDVSYFLTHHYFLLIGIVVVVGVTLFSLRKVAAAQRGFDWISIRLPVIGTIVQEVNAARTTRTLSSLLSAGVSISRAMEITSDVLQNSYYKKIVNRAIVVVQKGDPISGVFKEESKLYPIMVGEMMEVGEETGKLGSMLTDIALFYEAEVEAKTKDLSTIIEPVLMIFIGASVGFFAVSMLSPMYSILGSIN